MLRVDHLKGKVIRFFVASEGKESEEKRKENDKKNDNKSKSSHLFRQKRRYSFHSLFHSCLPPLPPSSDEDDDSFRGREKEGKSRERDVQE